MRPTCICLTTLILHSILISVHGSESNKTASEKSPQEWKQPVTYLQQAGWCWFQDPRAIIHRNKLFVGGVDGQNGDVKVAIHDLPQRQHLSTIILHERFEADDHNAPALFPRSDGSVLAVWAKHAREKIHYFSISDTKTHTQWGERKQFVHSYDSNKGVTYMNLYKTHGDNTLYNFFRDGKTYNPSYITSQNEGLSWGNPTRFIADEVEGRNRPYPRYVQIDNNTVGVSFTDAHPRKFGNSLYYAEFRNGAFLNADGSKIKHIKEGPLRTSEAEKIFTGSEVNFKPEGFGSVPRSVWTCAMATDQNSYPYIGYTLYLSNDDNRFRLASWNGTQWIDREIAYAGSCLYPRESSYTGLMAFDPADPNTIYISTNVDPSTGTDIRGIHELYVATLSATDDVSTIKWQAITSDSIHPNIRPLVVIGDGYKLLLWLRGPYRSFRDYATDVVGIPR